MAQYPDKNQTVESSLAATRRDRERVSAMLRERGVSPTKQRISIAMELLLEPTHLCADDVARKVAAHDRNVSRATVYNTLRCFVDHGLVRQVNVGADRVFYDSNTVPHHHVYDPENGELTDIGHSEVNITGLPELPEGRVLDSVELVIRLKPAPSGQE